MEASIRGDFLLKNIGLRGEEVTDVLCKFTNWGVKRMRIGIIEPTLTTPANFDMPYHCCEFLIPSLLNRGVLDTRAHITQVR